MIVRMNKKSSALDVLQLCTFNFYLGGSRRMADKFQEQCHDCMCRGESLPNFCISVTEDTDYDFYATYSREVEAYLADNGFERSNVDQVYFDTECMSIFRRDNVQVVLRKDANFYSTVFESIDLAVYYHYLWKSSPMQPNRALIGNIFNMLFKIAHMTKGV